MPDAPDFAGIVLPFEPTSFFYEGEYDPAALVEAIKTSPELADFKDEDGNAQSAVRLDSDEAGTGYWITVPNTVDKGSVDAGLSKYDEVKTQMDADAESAPVDPLAAVVKAITDASDFDEAKKNLAALTA